MKMAADDMDYETSKMILSWVINYFVRSSPWEYGEDILLVDSGIIAAGKFLTKNEWLSNIGGSELEEQRLILNCSKTHIIPPLKETFPFFVFFGDWYGYYIDHPKEGFLVDEKYNNLFENLIELEFCYKRDVYFYWTELARQNNLWGGDFHESYFFEPIPDYRCNPKIWKEMPRL